MKDINVLINNNIAVNTKIQSQEEKELYDEALEYFFSQIESRRSKLKSYMENSDVENYSLVAEILKVASKELGFNSLADLAYKHEVNAKTKDMDYVKNNFEYLINELNRIENVLKKYLGIEEVPSNNIQPEVKDKILVVDDSNLIRNLIVKMINNDYEIITATDGKEAIDALSLDNSHLIGILLDLNMPNVNGFQVLEYLKQNNLFERMSVAIITGDDSKETVLKAFDYPIVDVLAKPFNESDVKRVITAMITHR